MTPDRSIQPFLDISIKAIGAPLTEERFTEIARTLPELDPTLMSELGREIIDISPIDPRRAHALAWLADRVASLRPADEFTHSLAAWYLGVAFNQLCYPRDVEQVLLRARNGFMKLGESAWVAACDWQLYSQSWTKPSLSVTEESLTAALTGLEGSKLIDFLPHCRLALAYAQILRMKFEDARQNIRISEEYFTEGGDRVNQARCWLHKASIMRREGRLDEGMRLLEKSRIVFSEFGMHSDIAKAEMQLGLSLLIKSENLTSAGEQLETAGNLFGDLGMELWQATCLTNLGYVRLLTGLLEEANTSFLLAGEAFSRHGVNGLTADNLNDSGKLSLMRGYPLQSIEQFKQARKIHQEIGFQLPAAIEGGNLGKAYGYAGRYQDAIYHLEQAANTFREMKNTVRLGAVEQSLAAIWSQLNQPTLALDYLDSASRHFEAADQKALLASVYTDRAEIFFSINKRRAAIDCLSIALGLSATHGLTPQAARAHRFLGEVLLNGEAELAESLHHIQIARDDFEKMGMWMDLAETLMVLGQYYIKISDLGVAQDVFEQALKLSEGTLHEVDWRIHANLAALAEIRSDDEKILAQYRQGMDALARIRDNFWQPSLVGSYLRSTSEFVNKAIQYTVQIRESELSLLFMEKSKASTLVSQMLSNKLSVLGGTSEELNRVKAEINWLKEKLRESSKSTSLVRNAIQSREYRSRLIQKAKQYDGLMAALERKERSFAAPGMLQNFDHRVFRASANSRFGQKWVALDYYLTNHQLNIVMVSPQDCRVFHVLVSNRFHQILDDLFRTGQYPIPTEEELSFLGGLLLPADLSEYLSPDSTLILSPHQKLHGIPWSILRPAFRPEQLVQICIPCVVPSLHSLSLIWERKWQPGGNGLLIGISDFQGRNIQLPSVADEIAALAPHIGREGKVLREHEATWEKLMQLAHQQESEAGLSRFDWMHIASHFSVDKFTGRLGGLMFFDREIWLDQLRDLAPMPQLVTFSACNSIYSFLYEGDEHVGLASTCFIAGAGSVIGSLWPVLDRAAAEFMQLFYAYYFETGLPAKASAKAQRHLLESGAPLEHWAGFTCHGAP